MCIEGEFIKYFKFYRFVFANYERIIKSFPLKIITNFRIDILFNNKEYIDILNV